MWTLSDLLVITNEQCHLSAAFIMVGDTGIEPVTSCMSSNEGSFQN